MTIKLTLLGLDHRTAPVAVREQAAIASEELAKALAGLRAYAGRAVVLSTCNRTEVYAGSDRRAEAAVLAFLGERLKLAGPGLLRYLYVKRGEDAAEHLFRLASGLESLIVGEYEVLGQVRHALDAAEAAGMTDLPLRQTFQSAIRAGRRVREETAISRNALSVSSVAIDLAAGIIGDLRQSRLIVIGAGEAGALVAKVARQRGAPEVVIASRTRQRAEALATLCHGSPIDLAGLPQALAAASIVVTCAGAPHRILGVNTVRAALATRSEQPLVIIDIAIPRNVDPEVGRLPGVHLYNIDHLTEIAGANRQHRQAEVERAEAILSAELTRLVEWWHDFEVRPVVGALMSRAEAIRSAQLGKTLRKLPPLSDEQMESLEAMTKSIVTKVLLDPVRYLKANGDGRHTELVTELFRLDGLEKDA